MMSRRLARSVANFCKAPRRCFSAEVVLGVTSGAKRLEPAEFVSHISEITQQNDASKALPKLRPWPELLKRVQKRSPGFTGQEVYQLLSVLLAGPNRIAIDFATRKSPAIRDVFLIDLVENLEEGAHELSNVQLAHVIYLIANKSRRVLFPALRVTDPANEPSSASNFSGDDIVSALIEEVQNREWDGEDKVVDSLFQGLVKAESQKMYGHDTAIRGCITDTLQYLFRQVDFQNMSTRHLVDCGLSIAQITRAGVLRVGSPDGQTGSIDGQDGATASASTSSGACGGNSEMIKRYSFEFWEMFWRQIIARDSTSDLSGRHWGRLYETYANILACEGRPSSESLEKDVSEWFVLVRHKAFSSLEKFSTDDAITFLNAVLACKHIEHRELLVQFLQKIALTPVSSLSSAQMMKVRDIGEAIQKWERLTVAVQFALSSDELAMFNISSSSEV